MASDDPAILQDPVEINNHMLPPESSTLIGLPPVLSHGLVSVTVVSGLSLVSCTALFIYLTYKLIRWHVRVKHPANRDRRNSSYQSTDFTLGLAARHFHRKGSRSSGMDLESGQRKRKPEPQLNQFILLIYNLMLADMHQGLAFFFNAVWLAKDAVVVESGTCFAQGWFLSTGDLAASLCALNIAIHNYCIIVMGWKPPQWMVVTANILVWVVDYGLAGLGIAITRNGQAYGGFYVRAGAWCWMNVHYQTLRLTIHYLYIFISLLVTSVLYILIFFSLRQRKTDDASTISGESTTGVTENDTLTTASPRDGVPVPELDEGRLLQQAIKSKGHRHAFLLYPIIFVLCTLPLAIGRIATMAGYVVPLEVFCVVGTLISSNGWLDVVLWGITRRSLVFGDVGTSENLGLEGFSFMRTPANRRYGNMVWVEGAGTRMSREQGFRAWAGDDEEDEKSVFWQRSVRSVRRVLGMRCPCPKKGKEVGRLDRRMTGWNGFMSQESLDRGLRGEGRLAIRMERVTQVVIEVDPHAKERWREPSLRSVKSNHEYENMDLPPIT